MRLSWLLPPIRTTAFKWVSESWKGTQTLEALRKVATFATLDAKLLSALTNIITGDFARKVDTFKETEATAGKIVRGRQVLFMLHDHFSTNIKHGSLMHPRICSVCNYVVRT